MLAEKLVEEFVIQVDEQDIHSKLSNTQRESNDGVLEYCLKSYSLSHKYKLSHGAIIKYTRDSLRCRDLQLATLWARIFHVFTKYNIL